MPLFLYTYTNKLDKKGRISVPAPYRSELEASAFHGFVVFPHPDLDCLEGWDRERMSRYAEGMDDFPPMSAEYAAISSIMTKSKDVPFDPEGRVAIPPWMLEESGISGEVEFAGRGQTFQLWNPDALKEFNMETAKIAKSTGERVHLAPRRRGGGDD